MDCGENNILHKEETAAVCDDEQKSKRKYDIIVFGGSGFTGRLVVTEMYRFSQTYDFTWAVAGRDMNKLRTALDDALQQLHHTGTAPGPADAVNVEITSDHDSGLYPEPRDYKNKPTIDTVYCDVSDVKTVAEMTLAAKVVINCVGPYCVYGETVVEQCVSNYTHYVDVTAESLFTDHMAYAYDDQARASGSVVVNALGMESVPSDMGVEFLYQHFNGRLQHVDAYMKIHDSCGRDVVLKSGGALMNDGTWTSALLHLAKRKRRRHYRDLLDESMTGMSECRPKPNVSKKLHRRRIYTPRPGDGGANKAGSDAPREWCFTFPEPDQAIVARSIHHARTTDGLPYDFHVRNYMIVGGLTVSVLALFAYLLLSAAAAFRPVRNLFARHPRLFSLGLATKAGPDERSMNDLRMSLTLIGRGLTSRAGGDVEVTATDHAGDVAKQTNDFTATRETTVKVVAANPGYGFTSKSVVLGAITILKDFERIPKGGVLTPAAAFRHTRYMDRLIKHGVATFEVESDEIVGATKMSA